MMTEKQETTFTVRIYLSGPVDFAKTILRRECLQRGLCVTVTATLFVYKGGEESGYVVGLINYPRFPSTPVEIEATARELASILLAETYQHSALVETPITSFWMSARKDQ